ncbi:hypothetical protein HYX17_03770 [Candidatus Woesearchaeota archaeon]|nr:hypothetical protein [Candidatus Woesearchaeota archaeon]
MIQPITKINKKKREAKKEKIVIGFIYLVLAFAVIVLFFSAKSMFFSANVVAEETTNQEIAQVPAMGKMSLTSYDKELGKKMMDKNNDGKCDACGMSVEICTDSGQMQCNMDSESTIGVLESQHIHADWKIYINNKALSFEGKDHMGRMQANISVSSFIHVDSGAPAPENIGDILHMHAAGIPLWIFFESIGMKFEKDCFTVDTGVKYCNNAEKSLKFYVNGKENIEFGDYVFNDNDKILISYDNKNWDASRQLNSITDFAKNH